MEGTDIKAKLVSEKDEAKSPKDKAHDSSDSHSSDEEIGNRLDRDTHELDGMESESSLQQIRKKTASFKQESSEQFNCPMMSQILEKDILNEI